MIQRVLEFSIAIYGDDINELPDFLTQSYDFLEQIQELLKIILR